MDHDLKLEISDDLHADLGRVAESMGIASLEHAAVVGLMEWVARKISEIEDRDPAERYFVNEALDELAGKKKP